MKRALLILALASGCGTPIETVHERSVGDAIDEGVDYLVRTQSDDGSWGKGRETTDFDHIARGTFGTGAGIRTHRIVPAIPEADWDAPHGRDALG